MSCASLETTVVNSGTVTKYFSYLGSRGKRLAPGETYTIQGDLLGIVANGDRAVKRRLKALERALDAGDLAILSSPKPHYFDETDDMPKVLVVAGGVVSTEDPCWGEYSISEG